MAASGFLLGHELARHGVELAAWTICDEGRDATLPLLRELCAPGVTTVITDSPLMLAGFTQERA